MKKAWLMAYIVLFVIYGLCSFILMDPNLTFLNFGPYLWLQNFLWQKFLPFAWLRTTIFALLFCLLFLNYVLILQAIPNQNSKKFLSMPTILAIIGIILLFTYNAFSYDLFNYIFNAKIVLLYHQNPHQVVALDFPHDPWLRFMNNTHTPAPYGYAWTILSLPMYLFGFGKFLTIWFSFKFFALVAVGLLFFLLRAFLHQEKKLTNQNLALLFFNPLFLIEMLGNAHNDLWMLLPALLALYLSHYHKKNWQNFLFICLLILLSIFVKYATLVLFPFLFYPWIKKFFPTWHWLKKLQQLFERYFYDLASLACFIPLLTERSKQFLPWYLVWSLVYLPLLKNKLWQRLLILFSFFALLRYLPWLYYLPWMTYDQTIPDYQSWQKLILWLPAGIFLLINGGVFLFNRKRDK